MSFPISTVIFKIAGKFGATRIYFEDLAVLSVRVFIVCNIAVQMLLIRHALIT